MKLAMWNRVASVAFVLSLPALAGCGSNSASPTDKPASSEPQVPLAWVEKGIEHEGMTISLGYRGKPVSADGWVESIAAITHEGEPVANAMVFNRLMTADGEPMVGEDEVATVYEPASGKEPALYAQGKLKVPEGASPCAVRFRIILPDIEQEWTRDMEIPLK